MPAPGAEVTVSLPLAEAACQAAVVAVEAVAHGLAGLGAGEGPVHVLHEYRHTTAPSDEGEIAR